MPSRLFLRRILLRPSLSSSAESGGATLFISPLHRPYSTAETSHEDKKKRGKNWYTLPPFTETINGAALGKELSRSAARDVYTKPSTAAATTALKWVTKCCPDIPRNLVQKLFRLRQVRREALDIDQGVQGLKRVGAKDSMNLGDRICLPISVKEFPDGKQEEGHCSEEEVSFIRSLVLYKDPAIVVVNKPPGLPVQGGIGIRRSLDELAATCLSYGFPEPPRLVHRLDRDCSGILVMGRTQTSATVLHSLFREKTFGASDDVIDHAKGILQRRYWALVIGSPRQQEGLISVPLGKVVVDNGKSERITIVNKAQCLPSQHAITKYKVIGSSCHGFTWLELIPLTGRKHQLRVHCAEVLGTPIVGDYKYGWRTHKDWKPISCSKIECHSNVESSKSKNLPFDLNMDSGSIAEKNLRLHLHSKEMVLPNVSLALESVKLDADCDLSGLESLELVAPMPSYMQKSWDITNSGFDGHHLNFMPVIFFERPGASGLHQNQHFGFRVPSREIVASAFILAKWLDTSICLPTSLNFETSTACSGKPNHPLTLLVSLLRPAMRLVYQPDGLLVSKKTVEVMAYCCLGISAMLRAKDVDVHWVLVTGSGWSK